MGFQSFFGGGGRYTRAKAAPQAESPSWTSRIWAQAREVWLKTGPVRPQHFSRPNTFRTRNLAFAITSPSLKRYFSEGVYGGFFLFPPGVVCSRGLGLVCFGCLFSAVLAWFLGLASLAVFFGGVVALSAPKNGETLGRSLPCARPRKWVAPTLGESRRQEPRAMNH